MIALAIHNLKKSFGGVHAVQDVSLTVQQGERRVFLGPNGAGKTTLFHAISGNVLPSSGKVTLFNADITHLPPDRRAQLGLHRTFQITNLFPRLTVLDNVLLAICGTSNVRFSIIRPMTKFRYLYKQAEHLLDQWGLANSGRRIVQQLSYGEQRQLEIIMSVAGSPKLLLLDEPTAGLSPAETTRVAAMVHRLPRDLTILMIEHDMDVAFQFADRIAVMHQGRLIADGDEKDIKNNQQVNEIYLGY